MSTERKAGPVVRYAGGKTRLLPELLARMPPNHRRYFEPFAGGAALFFALAPQRAVLGDENAHLIACYRALAEDADDVCRLLEHFVVDHSEPRYYEVRDEWNAMAFAGAGDQAASAAALLYLNHASFNGLWRVNKSGEFNTPMDTTRTKLEVDFDGLRAAAAILAKAELRAGDFEDTLRDVEPGDFVYCDPPYVPAGSSASFTAYTAGGFGLEDQRRLADVACQLSERGAYVMLSNSDTPLVRELYAWAHIDTVTASRRIAADPASRAPTTELIIRGYGPGPAATPDAARVKETQMASKKTKAKKQTEIPGTERKDALPDVEEKSDEYVALRDKRVEMQSDEKKLKAAMAELLAKHRREVYRYVDDDGVPRIVRATSKTNVTVSKEKNDEPDDEEN